MNILEGLIYYFPYYVVLVLVPAVVRGIIEGALKLQYREFSLDNIFDPRFSSSVDSTTVYRSLVISGMYFPLFEEILFRLIPLYFLGFPGLLIGNAVWILMHPTWQLQILDEEGWRKFVGFLMSVFFYSVCSIFYCIAWLNGDGIIAILYHMLHNSFIIIASAIREGMPEIKLPFSKREEEGKFVKLKKAGEEREEKEEFTETGTTSFVKFKGTLAEEEEFQFVRRKKFKY